MENERPYKSLSSPTSFRILHLWPAQNNSDPLECRLLETDLNQNPEYIAISYVWGDETNPSTILHEEVELSITRNLDAALRRFRQESICISLWVDSLCIKQQDVLERNKQIGIMSDIYRKASTVYVWLGHEDEYEDTRAFCEYGQILLQVVLPRFDELQQWRGDDEKFHAEFKLPGVDSPGLKAFMDFLLKRPWSYRAWTFQESYLARDKEYFCGRLQISNITMNALFLMVTLIARKANNPHYTPFLCYPTMFLESSSCNDLGFLLFRRRGSGCKDPRDQIYSILGVVSDLWRDSILVDYRKPRPLIYAETTIQIIRVHGNLGVFAQIDDIPIKDPELPTWVPNWQNEIGHRLIFSNSTNVQRGPLFYASGSSSPSTLVSADFKQLTLQGVALDTIAFKSPKPMAAGGWTWAEEYFGDIKYPGGMYEFTNEPIENALMRTIFADETNNRKRFGASAAAEVRKTLIKTVKDRLDRFLDIVSMFNHKKELGLIKPRLSQTEDYVMIKHTRNEKAFLMLTQQGILGNVNSLAQAGDVIVIACGGRVPLVLRPCGDKYTFIAESYVHGFMDGEAFINARSTADSTYDKTDRSWLERLHEEPIPFPTQKFVLI